MYCPANNSWIGRLCVIVLTMAAPGCCQHPGCCNDITPGAIPQPNGTYACQWMHAEMGRAEQDKFVIYQYEWAADGTKLTPAGQEHLARIVPRLPQVPFPIVIECSSDKRVDETRRLAVLESLANCRVPISPERVVLGHSEAEGMYGQEAPGVARGMLSNSSGGQGAGAMGGAGSTSTLGGTSTSGGGGIGGGVGLGTY